MLMFEKSENIYNHKSVRFFLRKSQIKIIRYNNNKIIIKN